jgi:hypothetical protein
MVDLAATSNNMCEDSLPSREKALQRSVLLLLLLLLRALSFMLHQLTCEPCAPAAACSVRESSRIHIAENLCLQVLT